MTVRFPGVVRPDRRPNPHYWEIKKVHQNVHTALENAVVGKLAITNRYGFISLSHLYLDWEITANGRLIKQGVSKDLNIQPDETQYLTLGYSFDKKPDVEYLLNVYYKTKQADKAIPKDFVLASEQFVLASPALLPQPKEMAAADLNVEDGKESIQISGKNYSLVFGKDQGSITSLIFGGTEYIEKSLQPNFWRPPTDNDFGAEFPTKLKVWKKPFSGPYDVTHKKLASGAIEIRVQRPCLSNNAMVENIFTIYSDGWIKVTQTLDTYYGDYPILPKFGMDIELPRTFDQLEWYGRGKHESYEDRKTSAFIGRYKGSVAEQFHPYIRPQENGNKTDVRWMSLSRKDGKGLLVIGTQPLSMSAWHYRADDLSPGETKRQTHNGELKERNLTTLNIDWKQMGVGGDNSWGAHPMSKYKLLYQPYFYSFWLRPVENEYKMGTLLQGLGY